MIKAELSYNPYIKSIQVKFNGQPPRINSLVEKHQDSPLQDWVSDIPSIFHDEMNGYGFGLDFYGTQLDYTELCSAFQKQGVSEGDVQIVLKDELESRETKIERIHELLDWLNANRYRNFDYDSFSLEHHDLFESEFVCIVLKGNTVKPELKNISIERVNDANELAHTDLTHTPIMFCIAPETLYTLQSDLMQLRQRKDITDEQLFFCIDPRLQVNPVRRVLMDHGIDEPRIVADINDTLVQNYFLIYPFTDFISSAIEVLRKTHESLALIVNEDNQKNQLKGDQTQEHLSKIAENIQRIQESDVSILASDHVDFPTEYRDITKDFVDKLSNWESRKTKITDTNAAKNAAANFNTAMQRFAAECCSQLNQITLGYAQNIYLAFQRYYTYAAPDGDYKDQIDFQIGTDYVNITDQTESLLTLKEEHYVDPKAKGLMQLFRTSEPESSQPILETTYYYKAWREHMLLAAIPVIDSYVNEKFTLLTEYTQKLSAAYHQQMQELLQAETVKKENITANLSEDEKLLQADNDWLENFTSQLEKIERS